jgi:hypothetical protein
MKRVKVFNSILVMLLFVLILFSGCSSTDSVIGDKNDDDIGNGSGLGGEDSSRTAIETVIDFAIIKQATLYEAIGIMSDDYSAGFMENDLSYEQIDKLFSSLYSLTDYETEVETAIAVIESESLSKPAQVEGIEGLGNSMRKFFTWASGSGVRSRDRILTVASNMSESQKTMLYNNLRPGWKETIKDENEFWQKMQNGDLDYKAPQMFNDFYHVADSEFGELAIDKDLKLQKIVAREGAEGVKAGAELMIEVTKVVAPSTSKGMDLVEKVEEYREKANKVFTDPVNAAKDEITSRIADKIGSYIDVDGAVDGGIIGESTAAGIKAVSDFAIGTDDPSQIASKGLDWGIAQIKKASGSSDVTDISIAQTEDSGVIPSMVIVQAAAEEKINVVVPKGKWDVKTITKSGVSKTVKDVDVPAGKTVEVVEPDPEPSYGVTITPSSVDSEAGSSVSFNAEVTGSIPEDATFEWDFGDGSSPMSISWNGTMSRTYGTAGTYTVKLQIKTSNGAVIAEDTAQAVIKSSDDSNVTAFLHTLKSVDVYFNAKFNGEDGPTTRTIHIDTRDYPGDIVWNGLSFSYQYTEGEINVTISGRFDNVKYRLATLDAVSHTQRDYMEYVDGWPMGSTTWEYDEDILVENLPVEKTNQYGVNFLTTTIEGSNANKYIGTAKYTENNVDDEEDPPKTYSTVDWSNANSKPTLKVYFFD